MQACRGAPWRRPALGAATGHRPRQPPHCAHYVFEPTGPLRFVPCPQVEQVIQILKLADWFSAHELRQACDERLCTLLHGVSNRQQVSDSREEAASQALEAGVQHCLTKTGGCCAGARRTHPGLGLRQVPAQLQRLLCTRELYGGAWLSKGPFISALLPLPLPGTVAQPAFLPLLQRLPSLSLFFSTPAVGWLLPWALQQLSRGDKDCPGAAAAEQLSGELRSQQQSAWFQVRAVGALGAVHAHTRRLLSHCRPSTLHRCLHSLRLRRDACACRHLFFGPTPCKLSLFPACWCLAQCNAVPCAMLGCCFPALLASLVCPRPRPARRTAQRAAAAGCTPALWPTTS